MKKINFVYLHPRFEFGTVDKPSLTDMPFMTGEETMRLALWVADILDAKEHEGLNKPSWIKGGRIIHTAKVYKDNNVWHYHCGPYTSPAPHHQMTDSVLSENNMGKPSAQVYHYVKQLDAVIVLGFSRSHIPFPDANSKTNPLRSRSHAWRHAMPSSKS